MTLTFPEPIQVSVVLCSSSTVEISLPEELRHNYVIHKNDVPHRISVYIDRISKADNRDATFISETFSEERENLRYKILIDNVFQH